MSNPKKEILKNISWALGGVIVNLLTGIVTGIFVARYLGPERYGTLQYVISYVTIFNILANFGMPNICLRELSGKDSNSRIILGTAIGLRLILAFITLLFIIATLWFTKADTETVILVLIYAFSIFANILMPLNTFFTSRLKNNIILKAEVTRSLIGSSIKIGLILLKLPLIYFVIAFAFDFFVFYTTIVFSYKKFGGFHLKNFDKNYSKYLLKESFPLLLSGVSIVIYNEIDKIMIRNILSLEDVGQYAVAGKIVGLILFIPTLIAKTVTPVLVKERGGPGYKKMSQLFIDYMLWGAIAGSLIISIFAPFIITTLYGEKYFAAIPVLTILAWKGVFSSLSQSSGQLIIIDNLQKYAVYRNMFGASVNVILNYILIPKYGIIGSAWATLISIGIAGFLSNFIIKPYRSVFYLQINSIYWGIFRLTKHGLELLHTILNKKNKK